MLAGHLAAGMAAKSIEPRLSLGTLFLAATLADFAAFVFLIAGIERFDAVPSASANRVIGHDIVWSHSLLMTAVWGALLVGAWFLRQRHMRAAIILFAVVLSHWILDVLSHRPDMQLAPGVSTMLGLGLWNSLPAALVVEGGLWLIAIVVYLRSTGGRGRLALVVFWIPVMLITLIWSKNVTAGMDPNPVRAGVGGLVIFSLIVAWAYGMNRLRLSRDRGRP